MLGSLVPTVFSFVGGIEIFVGRSRYRVWRVLVLRLRVLVFFDRGQRNPLNSSNLANRTLLLSCSSGRLFSGEELLFFMTPLCDGKNKEKDR